MQGDAAPSFVLSNSSKQFNFFAMKHLVNFCCLPLILLFSMHTNNSLYAQQNALRLNLPYSGNWSGTYERVINTKTTLTLEFQRWNRHTSHTSSSELLGVFETESRNVTINGYRTEIMIRHFAKSAMKGWFAEGGLYFGKHDVTVVDEQTTFTPLALFFFDLNSFYGGQTSTKSYDNVRVGGAKLGGGYDRHFGAFSLEISGGLNLNLFNNQNVRPNLPLKGASPYLRVGIGVAF